MKLQCLKRFLVLFVSSKLSWHNLIFSTLKFLVFHLLFPEFKKKENKSGKVEIHLSKISVFITQICYIYIMLGSTWILSERHESRTAILYFNIFFMILWFFLLIFYDLLWLFQLKIWLFIIFENILGLFYDFIQSNLASLPHMYYILNMPKIDTFRHERIFNTK